MSKLNGRFGILVRAIEIISVFLFVLFHGYLALIVYIEAMVNESVRTGTRLALTLQIGLGSAVVLSVLLLVGNIRGWEGRIVFFLGGLLVLAWSLTFWLL